MSKQSQAAKGVLVLSVAGILSKLISILYLPLLKRILGDSTYGVYSSVMEVFLFVYAITTAGAQPAVAKVIAEINTLGNKRSVKKSLKVSAKICSITGLCGTILLMILAYPIAIIAGKGVVDSGIFYGLLALAPCILITCILAAFRGYMQGTNKMNTIGISQIIEQFFNVLLSLSCAYVFLKITKKVLLVLQELK